jgi:hypothetical protein
MSGRRKIGIALIPITWISMAAVTPREVPSYEVARTTLPIRIDGRLDDRSWLAVPEVGPFVENATGAASTVKTLAKILYDDDFVYFAFRSWDENIWATYRERDQHLWLEEVVEVFVQADPAHPSYIELEVNPLGTMLDIFMIGTRKPLKFESWNSAALRWAVQVDGTVDGRAGDREWTCEMALPLEDAVTAPHIPPQAGDLWRVNLYRGDSRPSKAAWAWSPTLRRDFHVPERFGKIIFVDRRVP